MVLAFSGKIGSGKSSISASVAHVLQYPRVSFGDYVRQQAQLQQVEPTEPTRKQLQDLGESLLQADALSFCKAVLAQAPFTYAGLVVDGVRHESVLRILKQLVFPQQLIHIHITLEEEMRVERIIQRQGAIIDEDEQRRITAHSTEAQVTKLLPALADITVNSEDDLNSVVNQVIKQVYEFKGVDPNSNSL